VKLLFVFSGLTRAARSTPRSGNDAILVASLVADDWSRARRVETRHLPVWSGWTPARRGWLPQSATDSVLLTGGRTRRAGLSLAEADQRWQRSAKWQPVQRTQSRAPPLPQCLSAHLLRSHESDASTQPCHGGHRRRLPLGLEETRPAGRAPRQTSGAGWRSAGTIAPVLTRKGRRRLAGWA
jgi:hypothetical protein